MDTMTWTTHIGLVCRQFRLVSPQPSAWVHRIDTPLWLLSLGMSALQLQNLATLAAAAAAAQNSASPSTANPLSSNAASLGALASPGNAVAASRLELDARAKPASPSLSYIFILVFNRSGTFPSLSP